MDSENEKIESIGNLISILEKFWRTVEYHHHIRLWYRGQSDEGWELKPGVYRDNFDVGPEEQRLEKEQQLTQDFRIQSASLIIPFRL